MKNYLIVLFYTMLTVAATAQVNHYYVSPSGSDSNDGSQAHPWRTINHGATAFKLGGGGATVHVADGTYIESAASCSPIGSSSALCFNHGGTSSQPVIIQCDNGLMGNAQDGHCKVREASDSSIPDFVTVAGVNYLTVQGFDVGGDGSHPATQVQAGFLIYGKESPNPNGNYVNINYNYIHDMATNANDGNGFGNGCTSEAMIVGDFNNQGTNKLPVGEHFIGNVINKGGTLSNKSCNQFHGIYASGPLFVYENNIIGNVPGAALKIYPNVCSQVASNNLVFHSGWWGILVKDAGHGNCGLTGYEVGNTTVNNNIAIGSGFNTGCSGIMSPSSGQGTNRYANNLLLGNMPNDSINQMSSSASCLSTPLAGTVGTINGSDGATLANTLVNYQADGSGDYHLKANSVAIGAGSTACVSGGITPCVPAETLSGFIRPQPPSIGFDELGTSATAAPSAPTNLTATVQ